MKYPRCLVRNSYFLVSVLLSLLSQPCWGEIPSGHALVDVLRVKAHPRSLDGGNPPIRSRTGLQADQLRAYVRQLGSESLPIEPDVFSGGSVQTITFQEERRVLTSAMTWHLTGDVFALREAKRRALHVGEWALAGATSFRRNDQAARSVAWTLALVFDWLYDYWSAAERKQLLAAIKGRVTEMLAPSTRENPYGLNLGRQLDAWPYDSHGAVTLARLAVICGVLAGEDELFDECGHAVLPRYLTSPVPWGGNDGGYANGTTYAHWDMLGTHFVVWDLIKTLTGVDLWQSAYAKGYGTFIAYFLPPGGAVPVFGDDAETKYADIWATQAKAYVFRVDSPLATWYAKNQLGEQPFHLALLLAPYRDWSTVSGRLPPSIPHAVYLADIGWVAMHGDLGDRGRTSVYFKSSPYGSYNHSHADQNSFVIHARGRVLAIDSGYYDFYGSPHWKDWYKQTRAHNAITFDGGQGQLHDTMVAKGKITHFEHNTDYDIATGDAAEAYGGALSRAVRTLVYLRPDALLVFDALASDTQRSWEWNIHALSRMKEMGEKSLEIEQDGVRLCVTLLEAPEGAFAQTDRFTAEPQGKYPRQWHARYASRAKSANANFLALLDVECRKPEVSLTREGGRRVVRLAGRRLVFDKHGKTVSVP